MKQLIALIFITAGIFLSNIGAYAQPSVTWNRLYNGPFDWYDESYGICQTTDGNFVSVGYSRNPNYSYCALKINGFGDTLWFRIIPSSTNRFKAVYSVTYTSDSGCIFTGQGDSLFAAKMDINGNLIWFYYYGSENETGYSISNTKDNNFIICGDGGLVMKIDGNGNRIWKKYFTADRLSKIINGIDDGYIITGSVRIGSDTSRALLMKVDTSGNLKWVSYFLLHNSSGSISVDNLENSYIIAGRTNAIIGEIRENFILKTDIDGNETFRKIYKSDKSEFFNDLKVVNPNRYVICAERDSNAIPVYFLSKILLVDSTGKILRERTFYFSQTSFLHSIVKVGNGDLIFTGSSRPVTFGGIDDIWILRTDSILNSPSVNINLLNSKIPQSFNLHQNYPNPFNPISKIRFDISHKCNIKIKIFNVLGQLINIPVNKLLSPGHYDIDFDGSYLNTGTYFYSLYSDELLITTKKMLLIK